MDSTLKFIKQARTAFIELLDGLTLEQLNTVPEGFNNNIIWNFGHIVVSTQTLVYVRTGIRQDDSFVEYLDAYKKGSKPTYEVTATEVAALKTLALSTIDQIDADYKAGTFATITPYGTATYGATLETIEDVFITTAGHDNVHFGYALAQRKALK